MSYLRKTDPTKEMVWMLIIDDDIEWFELRSDALEAAEQALKDADDGCYAVSVFILECHKQGKTSDTGESE